MGKDHNRMDPREGKGKEADPKEDGEMKKRRRLGRPGLTLLVIE